MGILDFLDQKAKNDAIKTETALSRAREQKLYDDIACILWFDILYFDVLKAIQHKMDEQMSPFRTGIWGNRYMLFGPVKALTSQEKIDEFKKKAEAELLDRGFGSCTVQVSKHNVIVRFN